MARFRSPKKQARHILRSHVAHGVPKHNTADGKIHSLGTERAYRQALTGFARFLGEHQLGDLRSFSNDDALLYLALRSKAVGQKTLDLDRQAIQQILGEVLPHVISEHPQVLASRAYTIFQISLIAQHQYNKYSLSTRLAADAGLRAHELLTLAPVEERKADSHRIFRTERFLGRENIRLFTVAGKGGLTREVAISETLARELDARRLAAPRVVFDREIKYEQYYEIGGGKGWSDSFSSAAIRSLGWSQGGHGLRHTFAQNRMTTLQQRGFAYGDALQIVSQELGHFRPSITEVYLR